MKLNLKINNSTCEFEIVDQANKYNANVKSVLEQVINARENFDTDFLPDLTVYRTKDYSGYFAEIVSQTEQTPVEMIEAMFAAEAEKFAALEELEVVGLGSQINAELELALAS